MIVNLIAKFIFVISELISKYYLKFYKRGRFLYYKNKGLRAQHNPFAKHITLRNPQYISMLGKKGSVNDYCVLECWDEYHGQHFSPSITIGEDFNIGEFTHITAVNKISIGRGLLTGRFVLISDNCHGAVIGDELDENPRYRPLTSKGDIVIGNNVWIGDKATILAGVTIGDGCIIAANSVVNRSIPSYCLVAGSPARIIRKLR